MEGSGLEQLLEEGLGVVDREVIIDSGESPSGAVIQGGILIMLFSSNAVRDVFDVHLDQISGMGHVVTSGVLFFGPGGFSRDQVLPFEDVPDGGPGHMYVI